MTEDKRDPRSTTTDKRYVAVRIRLLTASLTRPEENPFETLCARIGRETEDDERAGRGWVRAVRHMWDAGYLNGNQAHGLIVDIAASVAAERVRQAATREERDSIKLGVLRDLGESEVAERLVREGDECREEMSRSLHHLRQKRHWRSARGRMTYQDADGMRSSHRTMKTPTDHFDDDVERELRQDEEEGEEELGEITAEAEWWRQATDPDIDWDVGTVLDVAVSESEGNRNGGGDAWIKSIQRAREEEVIDRDLAYLLLDRVAGAMIGAAASDATRTGLDERELELKEEILLEKGEDEMVLEMAENGDEFRERVEKARREWGVEG